MLIRNISCNDLKIVVLSDNTESLDFKGEHGLSLYIETPHIKILLDAGQSPLFMENAKKLDIDLSDVDIAILSHSHYDHADGFETFFETNKKATLLVRKEAGEKFYSEHPEGMKYIGPARGMFSRYSDRIKFIDSDNYRIGDSFPGFLIPHTTAGLDEIGSKSRLFTEEKGSLKPDDFSHEQSLVIKTDKGLVILNSCSHGGVKNIIREVTSALGENVYAYIGGFHLSKCSEDEIKSYADTLASLSISHIVTGHCTGDLAYEIFHARLGEKVLKMHSGMEIRL